MGAKASNSVRSMPQTLRYLAQVMVQDALELADKYSNNRFHQALIQNSQFQCASPHFLTFVCVFLYFNSTFVLESLAMQSHSKDTDLP